MSKHKPLFWIIFLLCFFYTLYLELCNVHYYPAIHFPNFKVEWQRKNLNVAAITFYSRLYQRDVSVAEIVSPNDLKLYYTINQIANREKNRVAAIDFLKSVWKEKHPNDKLTENIRP